MRTARLFVVCLCLPLCAQAGDNWKTYENSALVPAKYFDGDSFHVKVGTGYTYIFRLYGADCLETDDRFPERLAEQAQHFGIPVSEVVKWGEMGKAFTEKFLAKPFTVRTTKQEARHESEQARYFALVEADGQDLASALVENGLARAFGAPVTPPGDNDPDRYARKLKSLEQKAKSERRGIWGAGRAGAGAAGGGAGVGNSDEEWRKKFR